jgi:hypothetical protein
MAAAADGDLDVVVAGDGDGLDDVGGGGAAGDDGRVPVDHPVPDLPRRVVVRLASAWAPLSLRERGWG